jgi:hypothetical protein
MPFKTWWPGTPNKTRPLPQTHPKIFRVGEIPGGKPNPKPKPKNK